MTDMNSILKSVVLLRENGDATSTYDCILSRDDTPVKEFIEAVANSVNRSGQKFNEWWASVSMSLVGEDTFPSCAYYVITGDKPENIVRDVELDGNPSTIEDILAKYGDYIVCECKWNGGWGSGGYYIKISESAKKKKD